MMVAHMAQCGDTVPAASDRNGEDSTGRVKTEDPLESSSSSSSSEHTSSDEEEEEGQEQAEGQEEEQTCPDELLKSSCVRCNTLQGCGHERVRASRLSRERYQLQLDGDGTFQCVDTGLVFEVSGAARITYCVLSWSRFSRFLSSSWKFVGPIFDVQCDAPVLTSVKFPHSLCLADRANEVRFSVLHVKNRRGRVEASAQHSGSHVTWRVSSLSPVGPIAHTSGSAQHHGLVQIFLELRSAASFCFRVYVTGNNCSDMKDIRRAVKRSNSCRRNSKYVLVDKPPTCLLQEDRRYRLICDPPGHVTPEDMLFSPVIVEVKGYFEVFFEENPPFTLSLTDTESSHTVWSVTIRAGDCTYTEAEATGQRRALKRHCSGSDRELKPSKRPRDSDQPDGGAGPGAGLTDRQLMQVAKRMGREWKVVCISELGLSKQELEELEEEEEELTMLKFNALERWRRRQPQGRGGVTQLHRCLKDNEDVPNEVIALLEDMRRSASDTSGS